MNYRGDHMLFQGCIVDISDDLCSGILCMLVAAVAAAASIFMGYKLCTQFQLLNVVIFVGIRTQSVYEKQILRSPTASGDKLYRC
jgi:hypothetical protein